MGLKSLQRISIPRVDKKVYSPQAGNFSVISRFHPCCYYTFHQFPFCYTIWQGGLLLTLNMILNRILLLMAQQLESNLCNARKREKNNVIFQTQPNKIYTPGFFNTNSHCRAIHVSIPLLRFHLERTIFQETNLNSFLLSLALLPVFPQQLIAEKVIFLFIAYCHQPQSFYCFSYLLISVPV